MFVTCTINNKCPALKPLSIVHSDQLFMVLSLTIELIQYVSYNVHKGHENKDVNDRLHENIHVGAFIIRFYSPWVTPPTPSRPWCK